MDELKPHLRILGTRGIPAKHGGFETFANFLAPYMVENGWRVTVYCQGEGRGGLIESSWCGVRLVTIPVHQSGALGTIVFDYRSVRHATTENGVALTLGYNTALFNYFLKWAKIPNVVNMDGLEWKREKWSVPARIWLYLNERLACFSANHLIADHPEIKKHLQRITKKTSITMIPYGAPDIRKCSSEPLKCFELTPEKYILLIARPEPENSVLEVVSAFSSTQKSVKLVVLGEYDLNHPYQRKVLDAANNQVVFLGAIYSQEIVMSLRFHCLFYVHGHTVGGTNPSLIEAMGAGNAVLAHDNIFNRWVVGDNGGRFFKDIASCHVEMERMIASKNLRTAMQQGVRKRFEEEFTWDKVLTDYLAILSEVVEE